MTSLYEDVKKIILSYDDPQNILQDVINHGCISGVISEMTNYTDTLKFYKKHTKEISDLAVDLGGPGTLNGFDNSDPLCLETPNQNLLAWLGFEEICFQLEGEI